MSHFMWRTAPSGRGPIGDTMASNSTVTMLVTARCRRARFFRPAVRPPSAREPVSFQVFVESNPIPKRVDHLHRLCIPRLSLDAGAKVRIVLPQKLGVACFEARHLDEHCRARAAVAMVLRKMQHETTKGDLRIERRVFFKAVLPIHLEAKESNVELLRLLDAENATQVVPCLGARILRPDQSPSVSLY